MVAILLGPSVLIMMRQLLWFNSFVWLKLGIRNDTMLLSLWLALMLKI